MTTPEKKEEQQHNEIKQTPETKIEVDKWLGTQKTKVDAEIDTKKLKNDVRETLLTEEQEKTKEELEKDLASGMKVSEAIGKRSTRLDTMDSWLTILPFIGDTVTSSAGLLFFIVQNQKLSVKYRLPLGDKIKALLLQVGDRTFETLLKAPVDVIQSIPFIGWLTWPITQPIKATIWWFADSVFKANKWTAKLFTDSFKKMLDDAEQWNKNNPDKEQIDVVSLKMEMQDNMRKIDISLKTKESENKKSTENGKKKY